jgi:malonyl-CoA/methylmalonyl-CoA synthetase
VAGEIGRAALADPSIALVIYTSGTTGAPKGALIPRRAVAANLDALAAVWRWTERDVLVHALPMFHVHGLVLGCFGVLRVGGHLVWLERFSPEAVAGALAGGATMVFGVPTMITRLADAAERDGAVAAAVGGARLVVSGSAPLPAREHRRMPAPVYERYGLTETLIDCAVRLDGPPQPGRVGPPLPGVELRLVDEERRLVGGGDDDVIGEIAVRGPNVFAGYLGRDEATAAVLDQDGWFHTGDLATQDEAGSVRIVGRRSTELIKTGGYKVGAGEVEACLLEADGVAEAAVLGVEDADLGERIVALVVPRDAAAPPDLDALARGVAEALAPHKRPREVHVVKALPRNAMGKLQRHLLRDLVPR